MTDRDRSARELGWFFALALGATAILHGSIALLGLRFSLSAASPSILLYMLGLAAPAVAALVLTGPAGRSRFLRSALRPRGSARIYVAAVLAQAGVLATAWVLLRAKGEPASLGFSLSSAFPFFALGQVWVVLGEELGWRAFALARLERMLSPRLATLVLALAWGVWHAPMFFVAGSLQARDPVWLFAFAIFAWSCIHTALYRHSRPSIIPNLVFHGCANLWLNLVVVPAQAQGELAVAYALVGVATWLLMGRTWTDSRWRPTIVSR
ncbi:MAG: CPBP family intramembrane metalloprotease [Deltaproteobacteria bacterium]|nr:MAG: CPBP family intramembrane metalloprotease [Deltaproteobacteria bacterium]